MVPNIPTSGLRRKKPKSLARNHKIFSLVRPKNRHGFFQGGLRPIDLDQGDRKPEKRTVAKRPVGSARAPENAGGSLRNKERPN
jgi:hypothetical protein